MTQTHTTYRIAINDANLFIDLFEIGLIESFFSLNLKFHTTSLIMKELDENQQALLHQFIEVGKLKIREISLAEMETFNGLPVQTKKLSIQDLSLYYYALELKQCMILTGDNKLRKEAEKLGFEVHGVLWVFEELVKNDFLEAKKASQLLELLKRINLWLPIKECDRMIEKWKV